MTGNRPFRKTQGNRAFPGCRRARKTGDSLAKTLILQAIGADLIIITVDRRTKICIWIIIIGLANFLAYAVVWVSLDGDAMNGYVWYELADGHKILHYYLVKHGTSVVEVSRTTWIYSAVHSISIWITVGAVLLSMLTLAKDRIISSMHSSIVRGRTFITILATVVTLISLAVTMWFLLYMIRQLADPAAGLL